MQKFYPFEKIKTNRGQVAVVMILVIAVAFIIYAAIINLNKVAQAKTVVTIASNLSASQLGSMMASYGEVILQTTALGGRREKCDWIQVWAIILLIVIIIVGIILSIIFPPLGAIFLAIGLTLTGAVIAVALLLIALIIQMAVVEPGMTKLWGKMMEGQLIPLDDFVERGVQTGLLAAVGDQAIIPDNFDMDLDGLYGAANGVLNDKIGRFSVYYAERLKRIKPRTAEDVSDFIAALEEFLLLNADGWGLYDPYDSADLCGEAANASSPNKPSMCDPCCLPPTLDGQPIRAECCDSTDPDIPICGRSTNCGNRSSPIWGSDPFSSIFPSPYKFLYQGFLDQFENNSGLAPVLSFREKIGRDDEIQNWQINPNWNNGLNINNQSQQSLLSNFQYKDATGYYVPPTHGVPQVDLKRGIYSLFYKLADWGPDLSAPILPVNNEKCFWCDPTKDPLRPVCNPVTQPPEIPQLFLPNPLVPILYHGGACVDQANVVGQDKPVRPDKVGNFNRLTVNAGTRCANDPQDVNRPLWVRGGDRFCKADFSGPNVGWPYAARCNKHITTCAVDPDNCVCADGANAGLWPDDTLDDMMYGMEEFIQWAQSLIDQFNADPVGTNIGLLDWYPEAANWIEPAGGYMGRSSDGGLMAWMKEIRHWRDALASWLDDPNYEGNTWNEAWCYPKIDERFPGGGDPTKYMPDGEYNAINSALTGPNNHTMDGVGACLKWNAQDAFTPVTGPAGSGNYDKFDFCADPLQCLYNWNIVCGDLPRSLLPFATFDQSATADPDPFMTTVLNCLLGDPVTGNGPCTNATCDAVSQRFLGTNWDTAWCTNNGVPWGTFSDCSSTPCNLYFNNLVLWVSANGGSCLNTAWLANVRTSADNARNQVAKFNKRLAFLDDGDSLTRTGVWEQAKYFWEEMNTAHLKFQEFLVGPTSPAEVLTEKVRNYGITQPALPSQVIYAWQGEQPKPNPFPRQGYWHITRVDVRIPNRCNNACGADPNTNPPYKDPHWPTISTRTISWGTRRCYTLTSDRGVVKARVTRYDEDRDPRNLIFPMGERIWDFKFSHPGAPRASNVGGRITQDCLGPAHCPNQPLHKCLELQDPPEAKGAFLIGQKDEIFGVSETCWETINDILRSGVVSETCAEYYLKDGGNTGFYIKFIKCNKFED
ncbi:MAG: hypothetical protein A2787_05475 [Omnitrophica WOR_2 bacterium RIFCSPHIGHO2_01_FULL_48_9]|nr:MAG: hypothetical protein A2787_05475 [Omnitrophica WOR_2 bacterium RIFCSPHIGHO2_01_FULL_48_9]